MSDLSVIITHVSSPLEYNHTNYGFAVMSQKTWEELNDSIREFFKCNLSYTFSFGSPHEDEFKSFTEWRGTMSRKCAVDPILAAWLQQTFNMSRHPHYMKGIFTYGHFPLPFKSDEKD